MTTSTTSAFSNPSNGHGLLLTTDNDYPSTPSRGMKMICFSFGYSSTSISSSVPSDWSLSELGISPMTNGGFHHIELLHSAWYWNGTTTYRRFSCIRGYRIIYSTAGVPTVTTTVTNYDQVTDAYGTVTYSARNNNSEYHSDGTNFPSTRVNISVVSGQVYLRHYGSTSPAVDSSTYHTSLLKVYTVQ